MSKGLITQWKINVPGVSPFHGFELVAHVHEGQEEINLRLARAVEDGLRRAGFKVTLEVTRSVKEKL